MERMLWTEEEKAIVVKQWEQGLSAELIAVELSRISGRPFTRNMVIGKVNRLRSDGLIGARDGTIQRKRYSRKKQYFRRVERPTLDCRAIQLPKVNPLHIPMAALTKNSCTWPFGQPKDEDFNYCGLPIERGSFCAEHAALVYRKAG
jgi:GcrA cell cycle regulator